MMSETERAKVREHFKSHPDATVADIGRLLGRSMDALEIIEAGLIMTDIKEHAETEAPETKPGTARCRLEIEFTAERNALGYACNVKMSIPPETTSGGTAGKATGFVLRTAVRQIHDEPAEAMNNGGMLQRAFDAAERKVHAAVGHLGKEAAE